MNYFHYTPGHLSLSRANLSWQKNNFWPSPHISLLSTLSLLKNWGMVFLASAPRPAFSSNHTPQSAGRKLTTLRERCVRIAEVKGSNPSRSTKKKDTLLACLSFWFPTAFRRPPLIGVFALSAICGRLAIGPQRWYHFNEVKTRAQGVTFFVISCISIASRAKEARRF